MALVLKDRVKETTSTAGTGSVTLLGAVQGYQGFSAIGDGNTTYYTIAGVAEWEVGIGTYSAGVLSRDTVLSSSAGGAKVGFSSGIKDVFVTYAADKAISTDTLPVTGATSTASPNASVNVASLTAATTTANGDLALVPKSQGSLVGQIPTGTTAGGNKRGLYATDWSRFRLSAASVASGDYSTVAGGADNRSSGLYSAVGGGNGNISAGNSSFVGSGIENQANSLGSGVSAGRSNIASGNYAAVGGGLSNTASGTESFVGGGELNTASATNSVTGGGFTNNNSGLYGVIAGGRSNTLSGENGVIGGGLDNVVTAGGNVSGGRQNTVSRNYATVGGGLSNTATGPNSTDYYATVGGGLLNTVNAAKGTIAGGEQNSVTAASGTVGGGAVNTVSGLRGTIAGGTNNTASGQNASITGGDNNQATAKNSTVVGGTYGTTRGIIGYTAFPSHDSPIDTALGVSQSGLVILGRETTNNSPLRLRTNAVVSSTSNQLVLVDNSAMFFSGTVIANVTGGGDTKSWTFDGQIKRGANAASTTLTGSTVASPYGDAGAAGWVVALSADTTIGCLAVTVTGQASTTIRWVCQIETTEVSY